MSVKYDQIIQMMHDEIAVFGDLSEESLLESLQTFRIFELREGELLNLSGTEVDDYLFVLLGEVEVRSRYDSARVVTAEDTRQRPVLMPPLPALTQLTAIEDSYVVHVDNVLLEHLQIYEQSIRHLAAEKSVPEQFLSIARNSAVFQRIPVEMAERALQAFRVLNVAAGEDITRADEPGDSFYVLTAGRAAISRQDPDTGAPEPAGELGAGDRFGEDALLTGHEGLESVKALEDCTLLALSKGDFDELLARELVPGVTPAVAHAMLAEEGCQAVDVRFDVEYEMQHIPGAKLLMFHELRDRASELDPGQRYVVYCNGGKLGAAATFTLSQMGLDAVNLEGGLHEWTYPKAEGEEGEEILPEEEPAQPAAPATPVATVPTTATEGDDGGFHTFVCSDDIVRAAYPQLALAVNARRMGRRAAVMFTNSGVGILIKGRAANMGCQIGAARFAAVMNKFASRTMRADYQQHGMYRLAELIDLALAEGVELYACEMSLETLEEPADELIDGVSVIQPETFLSL